MDHDLAAQLEWVAAVHHNTEHPHVHISLRGVDRKGNPCSPAQGIRSWGPPRAGLMQLLSEALGYRSSADAHEARRRETIQNRYTTLDRILQWSNDGSSSRFVVNVNHR